ncbi:MAG: UDP-2,4-diacetamido-2,4,6-trideoxy-beta-L-altropyranose hydrolase [Pseudomonadota bacterium]|nr:UDP-2,4-diacetamido-2,4,6-trideoxy-beta-L-altropyranose hydrolase [Pseudomonadota bacterium]
MDAQGVAAICLIMMKHFSIVFRTDASLNIGTGHVMRCLTLAQALRERGAQCSFICREHPGNLLELIRQRSFQVFALPVAHFAEETEAQANPVHASWLGASWETDAEQTLAVLHNSPVDWVIVDHYALDARWECSVRPACAHIMVIDDLADRQHDCDLLLDQNLDRKVIDYARLVPDGCEILAGTEYALLRPEFAALRTYSLQRRTAAQFKHLLITMGGVDKDNATGRVLDALKNSALPDDCYITVVMGPHAPWLEQVRDQAAQMSWKTKVLVNVQDMAALMAESDLAIGAAGTTALERCSLGLPTLTLVLAENQRSGAHALAAKDCIMLLNGPLQLQYDLDRLLAVAIQPENLQKMQLASSAIVDGEGGVRITNWLMTHD